MSMPAVTALSHELHRLAIAGTDLAIGDRRIADLVPVLERSGARAPVFATIAERADALVGSDRAGAAARFLQLNVLVRAVLTAQGKGDVAGELEPPAPAAMSVTNLSARAVQALAERIRVGDARALDHPAGRERFADLRLMAHAIEALDAGNAQVANTASERFVPLYGAAVVAPLVAGLDPTSKRAAARIIEAVAAADAGSGARLARQILDPDAERAFPTLPGADGFGKEARVAALGALGAADTDRRLLRDTLGAKAKPMRTAAFTRLIALEDQAGLAHCIEMLGGSATKVREIVGALDDDSAALDVPSVREALDASVHRLLDASWRKRRFSADIETIHDASLLLLGRAADDDPSPLSLARRLLDDMQTSCEGANDTGLPALRNYTELVKSIVERLIRHLPDDEVLGVAELAMSLDARTALEEIAVREGPDAAWRCMERASLPELERLWGVRRVFEGVDTYARTRLHARLPPPELWGSEWMDEGLRHRDIGLVWYLHRHHPQRILDWAGKAGESIDADFLMLLLKIDPGCAPWLGARVKRSVHRFNEHFEPLCRAVETRDASACASLLESLGSCVRHDNPRLVALRERLAERFG